MAPEEMDAARAGLAGVRGHAALRAQLRRSIERGQLHHAQLFVGPRGVGKATTARALARALHCRIAPGTGCAPDGERCTSCQRIDNDRHAGVEWIVPETAGGKLKVEAARELATRLQLAPFEGEHHVVVIDPAESLTEQATNALLKTLEEPRPGVCFVLVAQSLDAMLPTILSRCATVRFGRLTDDDVEAVLDGALAQRDAEAEPVPDERRALAMRLADGSPGVAIELALDETLDATHQLLREAARAVELGPLAIFGGDASAFGQAWAAAGAGPPTGRAARERNAVQRAVELWLLDLRERIRGRAGVPGVSSVGRDRAAWLHATDVLVELQERLDRNANARLVLEQTLLELGEPARG